ncbi:MAG TPA: cupin domain-containing protein, partial [Ilumatobacteraceae bacterium]|nr:cupin domain-containing protein [Ilumatobacteraceae bacterium]
AADEAATPPMSHTGVQMVVVEAGLVQVSVGDDTPVLRVGDVVLAERAPVVGWRNLRPEPARLLWICRD